MSYNVPIDINVGQEESRSQLLYDFLNITIYPADFKACHPLGKPKGFYHAPSLIKFVYFKMRNEGHFQRKVLAGSTSIENHKPISFKKHLQKFHRDIQNEASELNLMTTTRNSEVCVFVKKPKKQVKSIGIKISQMLVDSAPRAVQRQKQLVKKSKLTHCFGWELEEKSETPITEKQIRKLPRKQLMIKR